MGSSPKILTLDIETTPLEGPTFDIWNVNINPMYLTRPVMMVCFAAKWLGEREVMFYSTFYDPPGVMVQKVYELLSEADIVVGFNSKKFDIPHINRELDMAGYGPPAPYKQVDLFRVAKVKFKHVSNKLDYICKVLGLGRKKRHEGLELWIKVMQDDPAAWKRFKQYNIQDVRLTERLYKRWLPWIPNHPSHAAFTGEKVCTACGSSRLRSNGYRTTGQTRYVRLWCLDCGAWSRLTRALTRAPVVGAGDG